MKKAFFYSLMALAAIVLIAKSCPAEARHHRHHHRTHLSINVGTGVGFNNAYIVRQYTPVVPAVAYVPAYAPVVPAYTPVYVCPAPTYVEQVRVVPEYRPLNFGFSWNFFR